MHLDDFVRPPPFARSEGWGTQRSEPQAEWNPDLSGACATHQSSWVYRAVTQGARNEFGPYADKQDEFPMALHLDPDTLDSLRRHAVEAFPNECCGILIGCRKVRGAYVRRAVAADNIAEGDRTRRYQVDWKTLFNTIRTARDTPDEVIGFYHSHPDGSNTPSKRDAESAWISHTYVILPVAEGVCGQPAAWRVAEEDAPFEHETITMGG